MLIIPVKEGENIERALKRYKKKFEKTNIMKELRERQAYVKPSVRIRQQRIRAIFRQRMKSLER
jgi:small subunit ribosomal protein S21